MISSVETGQKTPRRDFVERCDKVLNAGSALLVLYDLLKYETHPVESFARYAEAEHQAAAIHMWEVVVMPGIFQTADYARALLTAGHEPPTLWVVLDEMVLRRRLGSTETHRAQLDRLIELAERPGITIQGIPPATGAHAGPTSSFKILGFEDAPDIAYSEDPATGHFHERPELVKVLSQTYEALRSVALPVSASLDLIRQVREEQ